MTKIKNFFSLILLIFLFGGGPVHSDPSNGLPEKTELLKLLSEAGDSDDRFLTADWGKRNPFNTSLIDVVPAPRETATALPATEPTKAPPQLPKLEGILMSRPKPSAIINDTVVGVGTVLGAFTVKSIAANEVIITDGTEDFSIKIEPKTSDKTEDDPQPAKN